MASEKNENKKKEKETDKATTTTPSAQTDEEKRRERLGTYENSENEKKWGSYSGRYQKVEAGEEKSTNYHFPGGFYYDAQLEDPFLSVSLHANTKIVDGKWVKWPGEHLQPILSKKSKDGDTNWSEMYGVDPIARCIMSEDFSYSIANNFSDYSGGNPIETAFENFKPYAPILGKFAANLKNGIESSKGTGSVIVDAINGAASSIAGFMGKASEYLNKALFVEGSRFSYFNGTMFNFNNMEMKFIVFSDFVKQKDSNGDWVWRFQDVEEYIKTLQPYVMGIYSHYNADFLDNSGIQGEVKDFIAEYVGFQDPPGGFHMSTKALDNVLQGTLRLNIGGTWAIDNLVAKSLNVNMSRVQAKHPMKPGETVPLYAEVSLLLAPASAVIDTGYRRILDHSGMKTLRGSVARGYRDKINTLKSSFKT